MLKKSLVAALAATLSLVLAGCGSGSDAATDSTFTVLAIAPLSGPVALSGQSLVAGVEAAAEVANSKGGIDGRRVEVKTLDDALDPSKAVTALQSYLSSNKNPDLLIPGLTSAEILAVVPVATQRKILTVDTGLNEALNDTEKYPYQFNTLPLGETSAQAALEQIQKAGHKKVAYLGPNNSSGIASQDAMRAVVTNAGLSFTTTLMDPAAADATPSLLRLRADDPDVLVMDGNGPFAQVFLAGRAALGWKIPAVGLPSFVSNNFNSTDPALLEGVNVLSWAVSVKGSELQSSDTFTQFRQALGKQVPGDLPTIMNGYAFGYNCLIVGWGAYQGSATDDADDLKRTLETGAAPLEVRELSLGPVDWGYSPTLHYQAYRSSDYAYVPAGKSVDGLIVPSGQ